MRSCTSYAFPESRVRWNLALRLYLGRPSETSGYDDVEVYRTSWGFVHSRLTVHKLVPDSTYTTSVLHDDFPTKDT
jgi:hypothetical protein